MKLIIFCVILCFHSCKAQSLRLSDPSSLNTGVFGEENHLNETLFPANKLINPIKIDTNPSVGQSFGLENQDPNLLDKNFNANPVFGATLINDNNNKDNHAINNNNDSRVEIKPFGQFESFTTSPDESMKAINPMDFSSHKDKNAQLAQNFFVSGSSNDSEFLIIKNEKEKSPLDSNSNIPTSSDSLQSIPIPNLISNQTNKDLPPSNSMISAGSFQTSYNSSDFKLPLSSDSSSSQIDPLLLNKNQQFSPDSFSVPISNQGFISGDKSFSQSVTTFPILTANGNLTASSNNFPSSISNNDSLSGSFDISTISPTTNILSSEHFNSMPSGSNSNSDNTPENQLVNIKMPSDPIQNGNNGRPLNIMPINDPGTNNKSNIKDLNNQDLNPNVLSTATTKKIPQDPIFGNPTPNGWIPQTISPLSFERSFQSEKELDNSRSITAKESLDSSRNQLKLGEDKTLLKQDMTVPEHEKDLINTNLHFASNESSELNKLLSPNENSSISDKVISQQTPPIFNKEQDIPVSIQDKATNDSNTHLSGENVFHDQTGSQDFHELLQTQTFSSSISDQAISNQNPPRLGNDQFLSSKSSIPKQDISLVVSGSSRDLYNSSGISFLTNIKTDTNETLVEIIQRLGLTTFLHYLELTGLTSTLKNEGTFTIFAPSNKAFDNLPFAVKEDFQSHLDRLKMVLNFHIANGTIVSGDFKNELIFPSMSSGKEIRINLYSINETQIVTAAGCPINATNKFASNGVVHILEKVMFRTPDFNIVGAVTSLSKFNQLSSVVSTAKFQQVLAGGPFTFFAPTELAFQKLPAGFLTEILKNETALEDVLNYHLISGTYYTEGLLNGPTLTTFNNKTVTITLQLGFFKVNSATISETDITVTNGVMHSIDSLLLPPNYFLE